MSEYQYLEFRSVDRPLTDAELKYAERQSTRAEVTRWSFRNEYHFGDFRGNVNGLLKRGYDVYLHYANFGIRTAAFRLPAGLPFPKPIWSQYVGVGELKWEKDRKGQGGILSLNPYHEPDEIDEIWEPGEYMDEFVDVRNRLINGDLRALYALWLCAALNCQSVGPYVIEPATPGGLAECVEALGPFLEFFGLDPLILSAASAGAPDLVNRPTLEQQSRQWTNQLSTKGSKDLICKFLEEDANAIKAEALAAIRRFSGSLDWPTAQLGRSFQTLLDRTDEIRADYQAKEKKRRKAAARRASEKKARQRLDRMAEMARQPNAWIREATNLVEARGTANYEAAAEILADLREAIGGGENLACQHAAHLAKQHPTLTRLKSSLRKRQLLR